MQSQPANNSPQPPDTDHVRAPLVIGITGHRDIREEDRPHLTAAVKSILLELRGKYRSTPLVVLSALAEGADRLAAQAAMSAEVGARLFVPLPMPQALYERDFGAESLEEFRTLLGHADGMEEMPLVSGSTLADIAHHGPQRDLQYQSVGEYIVRKCQILIALWDGEKPKLVGGTAAVVEFQIDGLPQLEAYSFEALEGFPVYQIVTPRKENPLPKKTAFERLEVYPASFKGDTAKARRYYDQMFSRIDEFNRYVDNPSAKLRFAMWKSKDYLLDGTDECQLPVGSRIELDRYSLADALAIKFQREKVGFDRQLHIVMFMAVLFFALFAHTPSHHPGFLLFALALVGWGYFRYAAFRKHDRDTNFEDYRAMAEGLRVRFFWRLVGLSESVTNYYFGKQRSELDWIRNGFRGWDVHADAGHALSADNLRERVEFVRTHWVEDQRNFFHGRARRDRHRQERIEAISKVLARFGVVVGIAVFASVLFQCWHELWAHRMLWHCEELWGGRPIVLIEIALAGAALWHNYGNRMAYREHVKQYTRMEGVFSRANEVLATTVDPQKSLQCIKSLGREALGENGDWVLLHRERPLEVPHP